MRFHLTPEQVAIQDAVRGTLADAWPMERLHRFADSGDDFDADSWSALSQLGLFGILVPDSGMGLLDAALVSEIAGEAAAPGPVIGQMLAVAAVSASSCASAKPFLDALCSGETVATLALDSDLVQSARHAHLSLPGEVGTMLFDWRRVKRYETPILETWRRAHYEQRSLYELPYTVAEGLARRHGISRARFLSGIAPQLTGGERLRLQATAERHRVDRIGMDLATAPLTRLAIYALSLSRPERARRRDELTGALHAAARRAAGRQAGTWGRVVAVLDDSYSAAGSGVKRRRPLAVALATHYLLEVLAADYTGLWLHHRGDPLLVHPIGATGLGERILDGLEHRPGRLVIVSDGWDNAPPGQAAEVLRIWQERLDPGRATTIVHLNPVYDAGTFDVRRLGAGVATLGIRDAEDTAALVELARFATGSAHFGELRRNLAARVERFLDAEGAAA